MADRYASSSLHFAMYYANFVLHYRDFSVTSSVDLRRGLRKRVCLIICLRVKCKLDFTASQWRVKLCLNNMFLRISDLTKLYIIIPKSQDVGKHTHTQLGGKVSFTTSEYEKELLTPEKKCR